MTSNISEIEFYSKGKEYWETIPATVDGMLGGFSNISNIDVQASSRFLSLFLQDKWNPVGNENALDCGSGIGRVTKHLLLKYFKSIDMVEQNKLFLDSSSDYIGAEAFKIKNKFNSGLQDFIPLKNHYDVIWCQWVTGHLTDEDFILFLKRCKRGLKNNGVIFIKDNLSCDDVERDNNDSSVTRPRGLLLKLFQKADLTVLAERKQHKFPKGLYEVRMFALR